MFNKAITLISIKELKYECTSVLSPNNVTCPHLEDQKFVRDPVHSATHLRIITLFREDRQRTRE